MYEDYNKFLIKRFKEIFNGDFEKAMSSFSKHPKKAIRINTLKISVSKCLERLKRKGFKFSKIPWIDYAFFVENEPISLAATVEHLAGYFYIQDATSMLPPLELSPRKEEIVLDMTASPGGKTTHLSQIMENKGVIFASDVDKRRMKALIYNTTRMGVENMIAVRTDARKIKEFGVMFDKILLDAPCSSDGTIGKNPRLKKELSKNDYLKYPLLQKELIKSAKSVLNPGGILLYSTCSTAPEENEEVVEYAVENLGFKVMPLKNKRYLKRGMTEFFGRKYKSYLKNCGRAEPFKYDTQAFFLAKLKI